MKNKYEYLALKIYKNLGYEILSTNYIYRNIEIDLILKKKPSYRRS